jgi:hypothetical protein
MENFPKSNHGFWKISCYPKKTCAALSIAKIVLHSEQRNRPGFTALSFLEHIGHAKIFGKTDAFSGEVPLLKKLTESSRLSLMLKN